MLDPSQKAELEIGDTVTLTGGTERLTVVALRDDNVKAVWIPRTSDKYGQIELPRVCFYKLNM